VAARRVRLEKEEPVDIPTGWTGDEKAIQRTFKTGTFARGVSFVVAIGTLADAADHHPDILLTYPAVTVTLTTHDAGRVTGRDLRLAAQIDRAWDEGFAAPGGKT
jgi:4a-hydroxytetrahydrobiopterin dehydratase